MRSLLLVRSDELSSHRLDAQECDLCLAIHKSSGRQSRIVRFDGI
jgi:hypothetical protein